MREGLLGSVLNRANLGSDKPLGPDNQCTLTYHNLLQLIFLVAFCLNPSSKL